MKTIDQEFEERIKRILAETICSACVYHHGFNGCDLTDCLSHDPNVYLELCASIGMNRHSEFNEYAVTCKSFKEGMHPEHLAEIRARGAC